MLIFTQSDYITPVTYVDKEKLGVKSSGIRGRESAINMAKRAIEAVKSGERKKMNAIWLETSGCFGEVISLLNAEDPDVLYMLKEFLNIKYFESIQGDEDQEALEELFSILKSEFVLIVDGAVPLAGDGLFTIIGTYNGRKITAKEAVNFLASKAKYIVSVGTCASYGGPTAAKANLSEAVGVSEFLGRNDVIKIPGCPANPVWTMGVLGHLVNYGVPELDKEGRPLAYYGELIHDRCPRRRFFDEGIFAKTFGGEECMFLLGCRGPVTYAYCPVSRWNDSENWPIGDNTTCIGCAAPGFPDSMEPFVKYGGGQGA